MIGGGRCQHTGGACPKRAVNLAQGKRRHERKCAALGRALREYCSARPPVVIFVTLSFVFANTGTRKPENPPSQYFDASAGSAIETNPSATNTRIQSNGRTFTLAVDQMSSDDVLAEIREKVDMDQLETDLMAEGLEKLADPQKALLALIDRKRSERLISTRSES